MWRWESAFTAASLFPANSKVTAAAGDLGRCGLLSEREAIHNTLARKGTGNGLGQCWWSWGPPEAEGHRLGWSQCKSPCVCSGHTQHPGHRGSKKKRDISEVTETRMGEEWGALENRVPDSGFGHCPVAEPLSGSHLYSKVTYWSLWSLHNLWLIIDTKKKMSPECTIAQRDPVGRRPAQGMKAAGCVPAGPLLRGWPGLSTQPLRFSTLSENEDDSFG